MIISKIILSFSAIASPLLSPSISQGGMSVENNGSQVKLLISNGDFEEINSVSGQLYSYDSNEETYSTGDTFNFYCYSRCEQENEIWIADIDTTIYNTYQTYNIYVEINNTYIFNYYEINNNYFYFDIDYNITYTQTINNYETQEINLVPLWVLVGLVSGFIFVYLINESNKRKNSI